MTITKAVTYGVFSGVILLGAMMLLPQVINDKETYFERVEQFVRIDSDEFGYSFLAPSNDSVVIDSYPNADELPVGEWIERKYGTLEVVDINTGLFEYRSVVNDDTTLVIVNNGNAMLEIQLKETDETLIADILNSREVIARTEVVQFAPEDWAKPFNGSVYRNSFVGDAVDITGSESLNTIIRSIGEERGYIPRYIVDDSSLLSFVDGFPVRARVVEAWNQLDEAALAEGIDMFVASGYRDELQQIEIFRSEFANEAFALNGVGLTLEQIDSEEGRQVVNEVLKTVAVPGYSKHHTGWTLDVTEVGVNLFAFDSSDAFEWMSKNNFENARRFGFIPSYPEGGPSQGPEPEAWEYVYVGKDYLGF